MNEALSVYDHMKTHNHHLPTLKLYLKNSNGSKLAQSSASINPVIKDLKGEFELDDTGSMSFDSSPSILNSG
jgi:hypothetical protein